jgi:hypothetical protein
MLLTYDPDRVDTLEITAPAGHIVIARASGGWELQSPLRYPADTSALAAALRTGAALELTSVVSTNPAKRGLFKLDEAGTLVRIAERGKDAETFWVGKPGPSYNETYVRKDNSDDVYLVGANLATVFKDRPNDWRDKTILKVEPGMVTDVEFRYGDTTFALTHRDTLWQVGQVNADPGAVGSFINAIAGFSADDFVDTTTTEEPVAQVTVRGTGWTLPLTFFRPGGSDRVFVRDVGRKQTFSVYSWRASQVLKRKKDFLAAGS